MSGFNQMYNSQSETYNGDQALEVSSKSWEECGGIGGKLFIQGQWSKLNTTLECLLRDKLSFEC